MDTFRAWDTLWHAQFTVGAFLGSWRAKLPEENEFCYLQHYDTYTAVSPTEDNTGHRWLLVTLVQVWEGIWVADGLALDS